MSSYHENAEHLRQQNYQRRQATETARQQAIADTDTQEAYDFVEERHLRPASSAIRYTTTNPPRNSTARPNTGAPLPVRSGNALMVYQTSKQPKPPRRRGHWLWWVGISAMVSLFLYSIVTGPLTNWWNNHQNDVTYGFPRTYQADAVVGHNDDKAHPTHFLAVNLNGEIMVFEIPGLDPSHGQQYMVTRLVGADAASFPVTLTFKDLNGDGKLDMLVQIVNGQPFAYINDGARFRPATADDKLNTN